MLFRTLPTTLFQIFCNIILDAKVIIKRSTGTDNYCTSVWEPGYSYCFCCCRNRSGVIPVLSACTSVWSLLAARAICLTTWQSIHLPACVSAVKHASYRKSHKQLILSPCAMNQSYDCSWLPNLLFPRPCDGGEWLGTDVSMIQCSVVGCLWWTSIEHGSFDHHHFFCHSEDKLWSTHYKWCLDNRCLTQSHLQLSNMAATEIWTQKRELARGTRTRPQHLTESHTFKYGTLTNMGQLGQSFPWNGVYPIIKKYNDANCLYLNISQPLKTFYDTWLMNIFIRILAFCITYMVWKRTLLQCL